MRRLNVPVSIAVMILFAVHIVWGGLEVAGMTRGGNRLFSVLSFLLLIALCLHIMIGVKLTIDTVIAVRRSGVFYFKNNLLFFVRRISGFALVVFIIILIIIFQVINDNGVVRLRLFDITALVTHILMVLSLILHLLTNISPLRLGAGIEDKKNIRLDIAAVFAVIMLLAGIALLIYYLRWQVI